MGSVPIGSSLVFFPCGGCKVGGVSAFFERRARELISTSLYHWRQRELSNVNENIDVTREIL